LINNKNLGFVIALVVPVMVNELLSLSLSPFFKYGQFFVENTHFSYTLHLTSNLKMFSMV